MVDDLLGKPPASPRPSRIQLIKAGSWVLGALMVLTWCAAMIDGASDAVYRFTLSLPDQVQYDQAVNKGLAPLAAVLDTPPVVSVAEPTSNQAQAGQAATPAPAVTGSAQSLVEVRARLVSAMEENTRYQIGQAAGSHIHSLGDLIFSQFIFAGVGCGLMLLALWRLRQGLVAQFAEQPDRETAILRWVQALRLVALFVALSLVLGGVVTNAFKVAAFNDRHIDLGVVIIGLTIAGLLWFALPYLLVRPPRARGKGRKELEQEVETLRAQAEALAQENSQFI